MDALMVCLILAAFLLVIIALIENAIARFWVKRLGEDLDRHRDQRQRIAERQKAEAAAPIPWTAPDDHLDLVKLEVTQGHVEIDSFFVDGVGYGRTSTYDAKGNLVHEEVRKTGINVEAR